MLLHLREAVDFCFTNGAAEIVAAISMVDSLLLLKVLSAVCAKITNHFIVYRFNNFPNGIEPR